MVRRVKRFKFRFAAALVASLPLLLGAEGALALGGSSAGAEKGLSAHLVMVLAKQGNRNSACTGTIVAPNVVLTAAHCVAGNRQLAIAYPEDGSHVLQRVAEKAIAPGYSGKSRVSIDMALVRLEGRLPSRFMPLPLDNGGGLPDVGASRMIAGYGLAAERDEASAGKLRTANVQILPRLYARFLRLGVKPDADLSDIAICTGDSGGPVLDRSAGGPTIVGVVYGREKFPNATSCGTIAQAVRVAPQRGWIDGVLKKWGGQSSGRPLRLSGY